MEWTLLKKQPLTGLFILYSLNVMFYSGISLSNTIGTNYEGHKRVMIIIN
jgi:hypothetical protein